MIDKECFLSSGRMSPNNWVLVRHGFSSNNPTTLLAELCLLETRVNSLKAMQSFLNCWREAVVGLSLIDKCGITTNLGGVENIQERCAGRLALITNVRMPSNTAVAFSIKGIDLALVTVSMNQMNFGIALWSTAGWVDMMMAKITAKVQSLLDRQVGQILVAEGDNFSLSDEQGKLVLSSWGELAQLNSRNFGAGAWG
jgi:hypothetical protein